MKKLALVLALVASACEHDPRYDRDRHVEKRPEPAPPPAALPTNDMPLTPQRTVDRRAPPPAPKVTPIHKRAHSHRRAAPHVGHPDQRLR
jgi:hypothetical protein